MEILIPILILLGVVVIKAVCDWLHNDEIFPNGLDIPEDLVIPETISHETELREIDIAFAERSREILVRHLGDNPVSRIMEEKDANARLQMILPIYDAVVELYDIPKPTLQWKVENSYCLGGYSASTNTLELNAAFLLVDNEECIREFLDTLFHELRHAVQHHMIASPGFWDADPQLRGRIAYNMIHYVRGEMDPEGYQNQLIERDARNFAAAVMRGI